jgi:AraC family transcriptional regulator
VEISPADGVKRRAVSWPGTTAEIVQATSSGRIEYRSHAHVHLLVLCERGARREGETYIEGLPRSTLRDVTRKLTFVPAGHEYCDWHEPRTAARMVFFYFDPATLPVPATSDEHEVSLAPRLFFEDAALFATAQKLTALIEGPASDDCSYLEALGRVLAHELMRVNQGSTPGKHAVRGGLAAWQQRTVTAYIEEHLSEAVPLAQLAGLVSLSTYHFCRAFKQSFGLPPHRTRQGASGEARFFGDRYRVDAGLQRDELVHGRLSQGHGPYADRLSPEPCLRRTDSTRFRRHEWPSRFGRRSYRPEEHLL